MKKTIISILSFTTIALIFSLVLNGCKLKKKDSYLSIRTINNYAINNEDRRINQVLYFTRDNIYNNFDIVSSIYLIDEETDSTLKLKINGIKKSGYTHEYKKTKYYSYIYDLSIPSISNDLIFENAKLLITSEDNSIKIPIGIVSIKYDKNYDSKKITVNSLSGLCSYNPYQSLSTINIKLQNKENSNITITNMNMGKYVDLVKDVSDDLIFNSKNINIDENIIGYMEKELDLSLSYRARYILKESYIEIIYKISNEEKTELIDTYNFYDNGYKLPTEDDLIYSFDFKV